MGRTGRRTWIKLYTHGILHGSVSYQLSEAQQAIWVKLLCMAGECNRDGQISDNDGRPFPHSHIAREIGTSAELLENTLNLCFDEGRIKEDDKGLHITNWTIYQSEYQRQKPYREGKRKATKTFKLCPECSFKGKTDEEYCPDCQKKGKEVELKKDYSVGPGGGKLHNLASGKRTEPWQEEKDVERDAIVWHDASVNSKPLFEKLRKDWPMDKQKKVAEYIRTHPGKFK